MQISLVVTYALLCLSLERFGGNLRASYTWLAERAITLDGVPSDLRAAATSSGVSADIVYEAWKDLVSATRSFWSRTFMEIEPIAEIGPHTRCKGRGGLRSVR